MRAMRRVMLRIAPVLHLTRVTSAFAAVANVWFVILWTRAETGNELADGPLVGRPLWALLAAGAVSALGLYAFGACLNDILDLKRDRTLRPERPLASGRLGLNAAVTIVVVTLLLSTAGGAVFGTGAVLMTLLVAGAILVFNSAGKFVPGIGVVVLGLVYAGHMAVPNVELRFVWPIWLVMTHALVVGAVMHFVGGRVPRMSVRAMVVAGAGWAFWSGLILWIGWERCGRPRWLWPDWVDPTVAAWPAGLAVAFGFLCLWKIRQYGPGPRSAEKIGRYGSLWLPLYASGWLLGAGHQREGFILLGLGIAALVGMTFLREIYGLVEHPVGFRR